MTTTQVGLKVAHCGCRVAMSRGAPNGMLFCPLHASAGEMRDAIFEIDGIGGKSMVKPAGQKAYEAFVIPMEAWERIRTLLARLEG